MAPLTYIDMHNMVVFLSKSDTSEGFDQIVDFLNAHTIHVLVPRGLHGLSLAILWHLLSSVVICLAIGRKFNFSKYIFGSMVRNVDSPSKFLMYPCFLQVVMDNQVDDITIHNTRYTSPALTQKVLANTRRVGKGFSGVETPLFASMLAPTPTPYAIPPQDQPSTPHASPPQEQPTTPHESSMPLFTTLMETCATLSQNVAELEPDKYSQALEILQLKKRVKKLEKKKRRMHLNRGKIEAIDADEDITLVDVEIDKEVVAMDAESQGRINQEDVSAAELTIFDDKDVTMTMAQKLIKLKAKKSKLLDEHIAQKLHDEEVQKAVARDKQEKADMERALDLQKQYDDKEENIDWSAVAKQNMAGYKMKFFIGMTYDKVRPIFEREYKKVQALFKPDKDVLEPKKKRVADETLLQESFKKLKAVEVSGSESTQEIPSNDPKEMFKEDIQNMLEIVLKIIRVGGITEAYQVFEDMLKGFDRENIVALWNLFKEKFNSAEPSEDKEKALWVELKRLFELDADDVL
nr:hypothetical protein [Tanacetum cinerariifolium]